MNDNDEGSGGPTTERKGAAARLDNLTDALQSLRAQGVRAADDGGIPSGQLTRLLEISRAMNRIHDRFELFSYVEDRLRELFDADNSFVILFDAEGRARIQSSHLKQPTDATPISQTILDRVRETGETIVIDDTGNYPDLRDRNSIKLLQIASVLCAPLVVENRVIGALQFDHRGKAHSFSPNDLRLLSLFSDQAATSFYNLQLIEQIRDSEERLRDAHEQLERRVEERTNELRATVERLEQEMSERARTQEALLRAQRLASIGTLSAGIAHEINNPLGVILLAAREGLAKPTDEQVVSSALERVVTHVKRCARIVKSVLRFSRAESSERWAYDLNAVVKSSLDLSREYVEAHEMTIDAAFESDLPRGEMNPTELEQVALNLIHNAVNASQRGDVISVRTSARAGDIYLAVRDQGKGMTREEISQAFDPFFTTRLGAGGTGLGLSLAHGIVIDHDGSIEIESEPGEGALVEVRLPALADDAATS